MPKILIHRITCSVYICYIQLYTSIEFHLTQPMVYKVQSKHFPISTLKVMWFTFSFSSFDFIPRGVVCLAKCSLLPCAMVLTCRATSIACHTSLDNDDDLHCVNVIHMIDVYRYAFIAYTTSTLRCIFGICLFIGLEYYMLLLLEASSKVSVRKGPYFSNNLKQIEVYMVYVAVAKFTLYCI